MCALQRRDPLPQHHQPGTEGEVDFKPLPSSVWFPRLQGVLDFDFWKKGKGLYPRQSQPATLPAQDDVYSFHKRFLGATTQKIAVSQ